MDINTLLMHEKDNVVTCVKEVPAGTDVIYRKKDEICSLRAEETIPYCHKIALKTLEKEADVLKYGELIGRTNRRIEKGHWVSHENIYSVPRDYDSEMV
ncbi:MAG: UxaA family hydrolase [Lachnospiraceae bacterium]|nr:UxaA family hydrolase [Lachnospiraceae bacterium]